MEIEPRFSIDKLTGTSLAFGPFKEWYFANNYIDMGRNKSGRQSTWYMGLGTDIGTGLPMSLSLNVYAKYQWQNYTVPRTKSRVGWLPFQSEILCANHPAVGRQHQLSASPTLTGVPIWGDNDFRDLNGKKARTNDSIASSHILALNYDHWHYSVVARYWHNGGQWNDDASLNFGNSIQRPFYRLGWLHGSGLQLLIV